MARIALALILFSASVSLYSIGHIGSTAPSLTASLVGFDSSIPWLAFAMITITMAVFRHPSVRLCSTAGLLLGSLCLALSWRALLSHPFNAGYEDLPFYGMIVVILASVFALVMQLAGTDPEDDDPAEDIYGANQAYGYGKQETSSVRFSRTPQHDRRSHRQTLPRDITDALGLLNLDALPSTVDDLKAAWRRRIKAIHPDPIGSAATETAAKVNAAHTHLAKLYR